MERPTRDPGEPMERASAHVPVMLDEVLVALDPRPGELIVDGTFGAGGYSRAILDAGADVVGIDRDPNAVAAAQASDLSRHEALRLHHGRFSEIGDVIADPIDGVVLDVGVSSMQLDQAERGFSFRHDGPLDMRMSADGPSAADVVNMAKPADLTRIIGLLGEERMASRISRAIVAERDAVPIETTGRLASIVEKALPRKGRDKIHPATRTFQAIRIFVNDELNELRRALLAAERCLKPGGRLVVVTFHSLEDRIVKTFISDRSKPSSGSRHLPVPVQQTLTFAPIGKQGRGPRDAEIADNPRARSARLRAAKRLDVPARNEAFEPVHALPPLSSFGSDR